MQPERVPLAGLERLFRTGQLSRRQMIAALTALGVTAGGLEMLMGSRAEPAQAQTPTADYLVVLVMDGFRADYPSLAPMPALSALAQQGISYDQAWVGQLESETPTGHATIGTGSTPKHDGIIGFEWRYAGTDKQALDAWGPGVMAGLMERDIREAGVPSIALAVKAADPAAKVVTISSEKVYAADALGGWAADYILYHRHSIPTQSLVPAALQGHLPPADFFQHPGLSERLPLKNFTDWDYLSTVLALAAVERFRPEVLLVNLPSADYFGHPYGGPATPGVMKLVVEGLDRNIGRIVQAYQQAGIFDRTLFVVTADHGMVPNAQALDAAMTKSLVQAGGGQYFFHTGGTAAYVYLHNPAAASAVAGHFAQAKQVEGAYFLSQSSGSYSYETAPGVQIDPDLEAAHRYMLGTFAGPTAPDIVAAFRENTINNTLPHAYGNHGGLNWGAQQVPLVMAGPGVRQGVSHFPARLMDIAPTALRLLGVPTAPMDGIVLADALADPAAVELQGQVDLAGSLSGYYEALKLQSERNIAEDLKARLAVPPSLPPSTAQHP